MGKALSQRHPRQQGRLSLLTASLLLASAVYAQEVAYTLDIPAQALDQALNALAGQTGRRILFATDIAEGHSAPALHGSLTVEQALQRLLGGSNLAMRKTDDGSYVVFAQAAGEAMGLDVMTVVDNQLGTITETSKSYTPGTIATATRLVLSPRETPQTVTVVTRQHMDDFNLTNIDEVLQHAPGVTVGGLDSERSQYYSRGFPITNFQYDGIPMMRNAAYSSGNTLSDMAIYDRIEVLKGATGLVTGAGGAGATLNFVRKKPTYEFQAHITGEAGSWDNYRTEWDVSGSLNASGSVRGRAVAAYQDKKSFQDHYDRNTSVYYGILEMDLTSETLLTLGFDYQDNKPKGSSWGGVPIFDSKGDEVSVSRSFNPGADWSRWEQYTRTFFTQLEHNFSNGWVGRGQYNYQVNGYDAKLGSMLSSPDVDNGYRTSLTAGQYRGDTVNHAIEVYASGPFQWLGREHELVVGASAYRTHWKGKSYYGYSAENGGLIENFYKADGHIAEPDWGAISARQDELTNQRALYFTARFRPTDDLALILGGRVTDYHLSRDSHARDSGKVVPFAGITYDLNDTWSLYASYTSIFLPNSYKDSSGSLLEPDEGDSYEAGIKGEWFKGRLNASLAYFEIREDDRPEWAGYDYETNQDVYEGLKAKTKGIEAEISGELAPGWNIQAGYTYKTIRRDDDNKKITTEEPEHLFKVYTTYRLPGRLNQFTVGGGATYQGTTWMEVSNPAKDYAAEQYHQEAYWLVNLMGRYQVTENLSTTLNINNLFDKYYYTNIGFYSTKAYGEPRNMMLTTRWDF
ncbi:TonB-dependent siderophore receptor [Azotobacter vinelandii]|uniref:TonB-dependent siderophore receptor n=1 Tax=Azotobacter vinelandii TaxID=354 RepID=UPI00077436C7|nr:TonB-dependent siderophore receptor [Azotobacter vinelandii]